MKNSYKISEVSKLTGLSVPTLRYYEELGLLEPKRSVSNYRIFTEADLNWIQFIKKAKNTGMKLAKIIEYSNFRKQGTQTISQRIDILEEQALLLEGAKNELQEQIDFLQEKISYYKNY